MDTESDRSDLYNFGFYCSATYVTSQVLQPKLVNKLVYQSFISLRSQEIWLETIWGTEFDV